MPFWGLGPDFDFFFGSRSKYSKWDSLALPEYSNWLMPAMRLLHAGCRLCSLSSAPRSVITQGALVWTRVNSNHTRPANHWQHASHCCARTDAIAPPATAIFIISLSPTVNLSFEPAGKRNRQKFFLRGICSLPGAGFWPIGTITTISRSPPIRLVEQIYPNYL